MIDMRSRKREKEEIRKRQRILVVSMAITIIILVVIVILFINYQPSIYYNGRYANVLRELFDRFKNDPRWNNKTYYYPILREVFYKYYLNLYNTSVLINETFTIKKDEIIRYPVFIGANETIYVETYGNGTYYYILSLDPDGKVLLPESAGVGNSSKEIRFPNEIELNIGNTTKKTILYGTGYLLLTTNSTEIIYGRIFVNKTPPLNLSSILTLFPEEYTIWLFQNWIKDSYVIKKIELDKLQDTRPPWDIIDGDAREITILEACILLNRLYFIAGFNTSIIAIDLDGDNELDSFALAFNYSKDPNTYAKIMVEYILRDVNIYIESTEINVKHIKVNSTKYYIILDPLHEDKHIPGCIKNIIYYSNIGYIYTLEAKHE